jgi:DeoR/GlpR family transcriptional regulator of sugar metabolism
MARRAMISHSARTVLMVDHAKFGRPAPHLLGRLDGFDLLVTDAEIDPNDLAEARQHPIDIQVAPLD